jgi:myo-inositol 2-dehydrogenase/D-chiro-inositol 1-dehydrogenase
MRVAVLGVGAMGELHARLLRELPDVDDLMVADVDRGRAASLAAELDAAVVEPAIVATSADALVVATPPAHHRRSVEAAVAAGIAVLCEKPLAADLHSTIALTEAVERAKGRVQVGFQRRFDAGFAAARGLVADGSLGTPLLLRLAAHDPRLPEPPGIAAKDGTNGDAAPMFRDSSIHDFDLVRWLGDAEVIEVTAECADRDGRRPDDLARIETATVAMRLANGAMATLDATLLEPRGYDVRAELIGSRDSVSVGHTSRTPIRNLEADAGTDPWPGWMERFRPAYRAELEAFLRFAGGGPRVGATVRDGLEAMRIAAAATRSFQTRRPVALDEIAGATLAGVA